MLYKNCKAYEVQLGTGGKYNPVAWRGEGWDGGGFSEVWGELKFCFCLLDRGKEDLSRTL